jgi:hypothetical protein
MRKSSKPRRYSLRELRGFPVVIAMHKLIIIIGLVPEQIVELQLECVAKSKNRDDVLAVLGKSYCADIVRRKHFGLDLCLDRSK